jgi:hypothetical protein
MFARLISVLISDLLSIPVSDLPELFPGLDPSFVLSSLSFSDISSIPFLIPQEYFERKIKAPESYLLSQEKKWSPSLFQ